MTILDVRDFYQRRDAAEATGDEEPCTGCDAKLEPGAPFSTYVLTETRAPRAFPPSILLCKKCTYLVMKVGPA
jgi:hypothetical protein